MPLVEFLIGLAIETTHWHNISELKMQASYDPATPSVPLIRIFFFPISNTGQLNNANNRVYEWLPVVSFFWQDDVLRAGKNRPSSYERNKFFQPAAVSSWTRTLAASSKWWRPSRCLPYRHSQGKSTGKSEFEQVKVSVQRRINAVLSHVVSWDGKHDKESTLQ